MNLKRDINAILEIARYSPSVHNSQAWHVSLNEDKIVVSIDEKNKLVFGDPTGRETFISLGIFSQAIILAAQSYKYKCMHISVSGRKIILKMKSGPRGVTNPEIKYLKTRVTDRSIYRPTSVPVEVIKRIKKSSVDSRVKVWTEESEETIKKVAELTSRGISIALSNPKFRKELSEYLVLPGSKKLRGIHVNSLKIPFLLSVLEPYLIKLGFGLRAESTLERKRWESASCLVFITTRGDMQEDWVMAGRTYLLISLNIEKEGFSQATSAALVEASTFHEDIESLLKTNQRLQSVIRIGKGSKKKSFSPRIPVNKIISTLN